MLGGHERTGHKIKNIRKELQIFTLNDKIDQGQRIMMIDL